MRGTTNPAPCCHLVNDTDLLIPVLWAMAGDNKQTDLPTCLPELTQNWIRSSHGHSTPSLKILCKSVQPFSCNVADKETKKEKNCRKTIPRPPTGSGVIRHSRSWRYCVDDSKYHWKSLAVVTASRVSYTTFCWCSVVTMSQSGTVVCNSSILDKKVPWSH